MYSQNLLRRTFASLSALALLLNLAPGIFEVPAAHAEVGDWTEEYWNLLVPDVFEFPEGAADYTGTIPDGGLPQYFAGDTSPYPGIVNDDDFVARYTATINFEAGDYVFRTYSDDGVRLYIDNVLVIDDWEDQGGEINLYEATLTAGEHDLVFEYYENGGGATVHLDYHEASEFGSGTSRDPYRIHSCYELQTIAGNLEASYELANDIDCSVTSGWNYSAGWDDYYGFRPIGDSGTYFMGTLEGNDYTISNLYINSFSSDYIGLFGVIDEGSWVQNLSLENADVSGGAYVGAVAGGLSGTLTDVHASGNVAGDSAVGGLVGTHVEPGGIGSSSPLVFTWDGEEYKYIADVGRGIPRNVVGNDLTPMESIDLAPIDDTYSVKISEEYNEIVYYDELALTTVDHAPGYDIGTSLLRSAREDFYTISETPSHPLQSCTDMYGNDCTEELGAYDDEWSYKDDSNVNYWTMNFGDLSDAERIELVVRGARDFSLKNGTTVRYVQVKNAEGEWVNAYNSSQLSSPGGTPIIRTIDLTDKFLTDDYSVRVAFDRTRVNYFAIDTSAPIDYTVNTLHPSSVNLDFHGYSAIDKTYYWKHDYSDISPLPEEIFASQTGNFTKYGDVTPLLQETDDQFVVMHHGDQMDITFDYIAPEEGLERSFTLYNWATFKHADMGPVGRVVEPLPFNGMTEYPYESPEAYPMTPENIEYLNTWNTRVINGPGPTEGSTIIESSSSATVSAGNEAGGLVGYNDKLVIDSHATGTVEFTNMSGGGLVGYNASNGEITQSYATGSVNGDIMNAQYAGGLVGENYGTISKSYALGDVTSFSGAGGLMGIDFYGVTTDAYARGSATVTAGRAAGIVSESIVSNITNVYATGLLTSGDDLVGGITVSGEGDGAVDSFWDVETTGTELSFGGEGASTETMLLRETYENAGWDFDSIWQISELENDGYPTFQPFTVAVTEPTSRRDRLQQLYGDNWENMGEDTSSDNSSGGDTSDDSGDTSSNDSEENTSDDTTDDSSRPEPVYNDYTGRNEAPESGKRGPSPWDASIEPISDVASGWYIRGENFDTVYYVDTNMVRHPFWDAKTFRTYAQWSDVVWVTDATLATLKFGTPMTPKPGTVLVKIEGASDVYAISSQEGTPTLHKIPTEALAIQLYGADWADYVIDIPPTMLELLVHGEDLTATSEVDKGMLKKRKDLN